MATGTISAPEMLGNTKCDICDTYKDVLWRCLNCKELLCKKCKTYHSKSRATKHHTITELANIVENNQGTSIFCPEHENEAFQKFCTTCNALVCLECIIVTHKQHEYKQIGDIIKQNRTKLEEAFKQIKTKEIPDLEQSIIFITKKEETYSQEIENMLTEIVTRGENLKEAIDTFINTLRNELMQQTKKDEQSLKETKEEIDQNLQILKTQLSDQEQRVQNLSGIDIIFNAEHIKDSLSKVTSNIVEMPSVQPPRFETGEDNEENLKNIIGQLVLKKSLEKHESKTKAEERTQFPEDPERKLGPTISNKISQDPTTYDRRYGHKNNQEHVDSLPEKDNNLSAKLMKDMEEATADNSKFRDTKLIKGNIVFSFGVEGKITKIKMLDDDNAWFLTEHVEHASVYQKLELFNDTGKCIISHEHKMYLKDMAITKSGELLVTIIGFDNCIMLVSSLGKLYTFADLSPNEPNGIHITQNEDVLVFVSDWTVFGQRITRLSSKGQILQVIDVTSMDPDLYSPHRITENINQDIVVMIESTYSIFGCTNIIIVVNKEGKQRFKYTGPPTHINTTGEFNPTDIVCTQSGEILISDERNNNIHVLSKDGVFIQFLLNQDQNIDKPGALDIDKTGKLWIGGRDGQVSITETL